MKKKNLQISLYRYEFTFSSNEMKAFLGKWCGEDVINLYIVINTPYIYNSEYFRLAPEIKRDEIIIKQYYVKMQ